MIDWPTRLSRYRGLIFDCDGTLTDSMPVHFVAWQNTMRRHGIEFTEAQFYESAGRPTLEIIERLSVQQSVQLDIPAAATEKESAFTDRIDEVVRREEVAEIAVAMHGRIAMSVASGGDREVVQAQLRQTGLHDLFPVLVAAEDTDRHKPLPDPFLLAARRMSVAPADCLVLEDSPLGVTAATHAGMASVDVRGSRDDWVWTPAPDESPSHG